MSVQARTFTSHTARPWQIALLLGLLVAVLLAGFPFAPSLMRQGRDSGIFAYVAQTILDGGVPYVDAWDNKTPMVYYINALAFSLFGINLWALWIIQMVYVFITSVFFFFLAKRVFQSRLIAILGTAIFLFQVRHPLLIAEGNFTETYALLPQVACLLLGYHFLEKPSTRVAFFIGLASSMAFLTKQNTVSVALMFLPAIVITSHHLQHSPLKLRWVSFMVIGGLTGLGFAAFYLAINGALVAGLHATFVSPSRFHNWVSGGPVSVWNTIKTTLMSAPVWVTMGPLAPFAIYGGVKAVRAGLKRDHVGTPQATNVTFGLWIVLTYLLDMVLANLSNRGSGFGYSHYYLTPMPAFVFMVTIAVAQLVRSAEPAPTRRRARFLSWVYLVLTTFWWFPPTMAIMVSLSEGDLLGPAVVHPLTNYVMKHSEADDFVLVWGASSMINFQASRRSPTRFHYDYPLIVPGEDSEQNIDEFLADLRFNQPALIVDTTMVDGDRIPPLDPARREEWWARGGRRDIEDDLTEIYNFVAEHCKVEHQLKEYRVYRCQYDTLTRAGSVPAF